MNDLDLSAASLAAPTVPERKRGGPEGPPHAVRVRLGAYQLPPLQLPPVTVAVQARAVVPSELRVIVKRLVLFDVAMMVYESLTVEFTVAVMPVPVRTPRADVHFV